MFKTSHNIKSCQGSLKRVTRTPIVSRGRKHTCIRAQFHALSSLLVVPQRIAEVITLSAYYLNTS